MGVRQPTKCPDLRQPISGVLRVPLTRVGGSANLPPMFKAVYAFIGDDEVRMQERIRSLVDNAVEAEFRPFNFEQFSPGDADPVQIEESAMSLPLGEGRRVILVRDLGGFAPEEQEALTEMAINMAQVEDGLTTLAILAPGLDRRKRPYRRLLDLKKQPSGDYLEFEAPAAWQLDKWVAERAAERGIRIDGEAAQLLVDLVGDSLRTLDGELTKLELYLGTGAPVDAPAVEAVVGRRRGESPWDLPRMLFEGDGKGAERLATRLLDAGEEPVFLVSVITRYVLEAYQINLLLAHGASRGNIIREVGINKYYADRVIEAAQRIPVDAFGAILEDLKECDSSLKSRSRQKEILIQQLIGRMALATGRGAGRSVER